MYIPVICVSQYPGTVIVSQMNSKLKIDKFSFEVNNSFVTTFKDLILCNVSYHILCIWQSYARVVILKVKRL